MHKTIPSNYTVNDREGHESFFAAKYRVFFSEKETLSFLTTSLHASDLANFHPGLDH